MSLTSFPEPKDLDVDFINRTGDSRPKSFLKYDVSNPHPGFGKDPNIINEFGHTKYPMYVGMVIVNNADEERAARGDARLPEVDGWGEKPALKEDGPTIHEYVAAGYKAKNYPPKGYASKSEQDEIDEAIKEEVEAEAKSAGWG